MDFSLTHSRKSGGDHMKNAKIFIHVLTSFKIVKSEPFLNKINCTQA